MLLPFDIGIRPPLHLTSTVCCSVISQATMLDCAKADSTTCAASGSCNKMVMESTTNKNDSPIQMPFLSPWDQQQAQDSIDPKQTGSPSLAPSTFI